jgi:hypothetical protein
MTTTTTITPAGQRVLDAMASGLTLCALEIREIEGQLFSAYLAGPMVDTPRTVAVSTIQALLRRGVISAARTVIVASDTDDAATWQVRRHEYVGGA